MGSTHFAKPFHLDGNFAPVFDELTVTDLPLTGAIPKKLNGRFSATATSGAEAALAGWLAGGQIRLPEHVEHGLERFGGTLAMLFDGGHVGKLLLAL